MLAGSEMFWGGRGREGDDQRQRASWMVLGRRQKKAVSLTSKSTSNSNKNKKLKKSS